MKKVARLVAIAIGLTLIFSLAINVKVPKDPVEVYEEADYLAHIEVIVEEPIFQIPEEHQLSGFLYQHKNGKYYVITAGHIQPDPTMYKITKIEVRFKGYPGTFPASILKISETIDCAVLKIEPADGTEFVFTGRLPKFGRSENLRIGEVVYTLGSPLGIEGTFGEGRVKNLNLGFDKGLSILHNGDLAPGSSGGPLLNKYGEIVGVNVAAHNEFHSFCLAVPIDDVMNWLKTLE